MTTHPSNWLWFHQLASRWRPFPSKPIGWNDAKHRREFWFLLCLKTLAIPWFSCFFIIIIFMRNVTYAGIYHWRVYIYRMGQNLLECKYARVTRVFFNDLYMWASFVTLNVFQFWLWLFSCETECLIWCTLPRCANASRIWDERVNRSWPDVF